MRHSRTRMGSPQPKPPMRSTQPSLSGTQHGHGGAASIPQHGDGGLVGATGAEGGVGSRGRGAGPTQAEAAAGPQRAQPLKP